MRDSLAGLTMDTVPTADGGDGSGNFNHAGRPGQVGGSGGGGEYEKPTGKIKTASGKTTLDKTERERYNNLLLGIRTSDGKTVKSLYGHRLLSVIFHQERSEIACKKQRPYPGNVAGRTVYQLGDMKVIFAPESGEIVTVVWRN